MAARISLSSLRRFSRNALSSTLTVTLSKKASTRGRSLRHRRHGGGEVLLGDGGGGFLFAVSMALASAFSSAPKQLGVRRAAVGLAVLLLLDAQDVGGALDAGEQVLAVVGVEEFAERLDAAHDQQQVVLTLPSANTASTRSCRAPCSRSWTLRRSAKKESRSLVWLR